ncbi:hypothetical protein COU20_04150, partial [Candidatus Kaiserbacteria bacterium CG10_big_fil_rev_8_21_14_0_10_59_10]
QTQTQNQNQTQTTNVHVNVPVTQNTNISFTAPPPPPPPPPPPAVHAPACSVHLTPFAHGHAQPATLTWASSNATSAFIEPGIGAVALSGSRTVFPAPGQVYTLTVHGPGGSAVCQNAIHTTLTALPLDKIPYTGFDFGPVGNMLYWVALLAFSIGGAYFIVYWRGGMLAFLRSALRRWLYPAYRRMRA